MAGKASKTAPLPSAPSSSSSAAAPAGHAHAQRRRASDSSRGSPTLSPVEEVEEESGVGAKPVSRARETPETRLRREASEPAIRGGGGTRYHGEGTRYTASVSVHTTSPQSLPSPPPAALLLPPARPFVPTLRSAASAGRLSQKALGTVEYIYPCAGCGRTRWEQCAAGGCAMASPAGDIHPALRGRDGRGEDPSSSSMVRVRLVPRGSNGGAFGTGSSTTTSTSSTSSPGGGSSPRSQTSSSSRSIAITPETLAAAIEMEGLVRVSTLERVLAAREEEERISMALLASSSSGSGSTRSRQRRRKSPSSSSSGGTPRERSRSAHAHRRHQQAIPPSPGPPPDYPPPPVPLPLPHNGFPPRVQTPPRPPAPVPFAYAATPELPPLAQPEVFEVEAPRRRGFWAELRAWFGGGGGGGGAGGSSSGGNGKPRKGGRG